MCLCPVTITRRYGSRVYQQQVPCGKCEECVKDRQNAYAIRAIEEARKRGSMVFFTLTYSPEALPMTDEFDIDEDTGECLKYGETQTLCRADVRKWLQSFRRKYQLRAKRKGVKPLEISYMYSGEYGPKTLRPHYHGLIFGLSQEQAVDLFDRWRDKCGFVMYKFVDAWKVGDVEATARYTAKYSVKFADWNELPSPFAEKPRVVTSQYFGMPEPERWNKMVAQYTCKDLVPDLDINDPKFESPRQWWHVLNEIIRRRKYRTGNGNEYKLPDYYRRKIFYTRSKDEVFGKVKTLKSKLQNMVTYVLQCKYNDRRDEQIRAMVTDDSLRAYAKASDEFERLQEDTRMDRRQALQEAYSKYMVKSVY